LEEGKTKIEKDETNRNRNELIAGEGISKHSIQELLRRVTVIAPVRSESGGKWNWIWGHMECYAVVNRQHVLDLCLCKSFSFLWVSLYMVHNKKQLIYRNLPFESN
jgi:hypothetical protein